MTDINIRLAPMYLLFATINAKSAVDFLFSSTKTPDKNPTFAIQANRSSTDEERQRMQRLTNMDLKILLARIHSR